jgi:uncharacterized HhH-GPD family protein
MLDPNLTDGGLARMIQNFNETGSPTGDPAADEFLYQNRTAILMGILFDQRIRAEVAFSGPYKLNERLGHFEMHRIADMDSEAFLEAFSLSPAVHRFSNMMANRTQEFASKLAAEYGGDADNIWSDASNDDDLARRIKDFPGFGPGKLKKVAPAMALFGF